MSIQGYGTTSPESRRKRRGCSFSVAAATAALLLPGCQEPQDPPMPPPRASASISAGAIDSDRADPDAGDAPEPESASSAIGPELLTSIATETSIYEEPRWASRRIGYLRAGAAVRRGRAPVEMSPKCPDGWYRVEPRGFVCVGAMATLDGAHAVAVASARRPRTDDLPYPYVLSRAPPPMLYARLPDRAQQLRFEPDLFRHLAAVTDTALRFPPPDPTPDWLLPGRPSLHLGNTWHGPDRVMLGRARPRSGFALLSMIEHEGRRFGVTTGLEVIPLDRTRPVRSSAFAGVALDGDVSLPIAFVRARGAYRVVAGPRGLMPGALLGFREAVPITEELRALNGTSYLVAKDGSLLQASQSVVVKAMRRPPAWAENDVKWIEVSIPRQSLVAYEGNRPVYATLVSTGVGGTGDPKETHATVQGSFRIYEKHLTVTMNGREASDPFDLRDVPFVQYFTGGYALHAAYWHDDFGRLHSHGCVNLAPRDAAWLYRWTDPVVPPGWHGATTKAGTIVYVHD